MVGQRRGGHQRPAERRPPARRHDLRLVRGRRVGRPAHRRASPRRFPQLQPVRAGRRRDDAQGLGGAEEVTWWEAPGRRTDAGGARAGGGVSTTFDAPGLAEREGPVDQQGGHRRPRRARRVGPGRAPALRPDLPGRPAAQRRHQRLGAPVGGPDRPRRRQPPARQAAEVSHPAAVPERGHGQPVGKAASRDVTSGNNASHPNRGKATRPAPASTP